MSYLFQAFFKTTENEMQVNPESKNNNFLLISYKLADISTYILMSLRRKPVLWFVWKTPSSHQEKKQTGNFRPIKAKISSGTPELFQQDVHRSRNGKSHNIRHKCTLWQTKTFTVLSHPAESHTHQPTSYPHVLIHPETLWMSYLRIVKVRERCYAFDVFNSELVLRVG